MGAGAEEGFCKPSRRADAVVDLCAFTRSPACSANFSPRLDDALAVSPLREEHKEWRQEHCAN